MKKHILLISIGLMNILHGSFHIVQFIQSMFFVAYATHEHHHDESVIEQIMHNPIFALLMGIIGILTLIIGIKDYRHHKKCETEEHHHHPKLSLEDEFRQTLDKAEKLSKQINDKVVNNDEHIFYS